MTMIERAVERKAVELEAKEAKEMAAWDSAIRKMRGRLIGKFLTVLGVSTATICISNDPKHQHIYARVEGMNFRYWYHPNEQYEKFEVFVASDGVSEWKIVGRLSDLADYFPDGYTPDDSPHVEGFIYERWQDRE